MSIRLCVVKGCIFVSEGCCSFHFYVDFCVNIFFCTTWKVVCLQFRMFLLFFLGGVCTTWKVVCLQVRMFLLFVFFFKFFAGMSSLSWVFIIHVFGVHQCGILKAFEGQGLRARLCYRKISDFIFWLYDFTPRWMTGAMPYPKKVPKKCTKRKDRNR